MSGIKLSWSNQIVCLASIIPAWILCFISAPCQFLSRCKSSTGFSQSIKAMDDIGVVMTPFGDVVTVILVVNSYVLVY